LPRLTAGDLKDMSIAIVGHRRKPLIAIADLQARPDGASSAAPVAETARQPDAERRQLTVLFCDPVGSTALGARLDPEDLREVIPAYHDCVTTEVNRFGGFVAKYMGDGVLVYFGYPTAQETRRWVSSNVSNGW
jgi:class 3 adenylate cyclase